MGTWVKKAGVILVVVIIVFAIVKFPTETAGWINSGVGLLKDTWDKLLTFLNSLGG